MPGVAARGDGAGNRNPVSRVTWRWIESPRADLFWYIGSPLLGLVYLPLIFLGQKLLHAASGRPLVGLKLGGEVVPVTTALLVLGSWSLLLDGPHFWPTLARTVLDPGEWRARGATLRRSFLLFLLGPALVLTPPLAAGVAAAAGRPLAESVSSHGPLIALAVTLSWAYFHVVRQHWGFLRLYERKAGGAQPSRDPLEFAFFHLAMLLPPVLLLTNPRLLAVPHPGRPAGLLGALGLPVPGQATTQLLGIVHRAGWLLYAGNLMAYSASFFAGWWRGRSVNGAKVLLLSSVIPVHLVAFAHPLMLPFSQAIVGVGHSLQYQRIVWRYGRRKYAGEGMGEARWAAVAFRNVAVYGFFGLAFTFCFLRGPWIDWLADRCGAVFDGLLSGVLPPSAGALGRTVALSFFAGWLFQHYFLDARIWRLREDSALRRNLAV